MRGIRAVLARVVVARVMDRLFKGGKVSSPAPSAIRRRTSGVAGPPTRLGGRTRTGRNETSGPSQRGGTVPARVHTPAHLGSTPSSATYATSAEGCVQLVAPDDSAHTNAAPGTIGRGAEPVSPSSVTDRPAAARRADDSRTGGPPTPGRPRSAPPPSRPSSGSGRAKRTAPRAVSMQQAGGRREARRLRAEREMREALGLELVEPRPATRAQCEDGDRPCPWVSCRYHLFLDVNPDTGSIKLNFPDLEPGDLVATCALDVADFGGLVLDQVAQLMNLTHERVRQLEVRALHQLRPALEAEMEAA